MPDAARNKIMPHDGEEMTWARPAREDDNFSFFHPFFL